MTTKTVTIGRDGTLIVTKTDDSGAPVPPPPPGLEAGIVRSGDGFTVGMHSQRPLDSGSFIAGLMLGMLILFIIQRAMRFYARREAKAVARAASIGPQEDRMAAEVAALARRTATLETIVTDPAQRTAREIEALR